MHGAVVHRPRREASKYRRDETQGGRQGAPSFRHDFVQAPAGQAALRQAGINGGKVEGQGCAQTLNPGQQAA